MYYTRISFRKVNGTTGEDSINMPYDLVSANFADTRTLATGR